MLLSTFVLPLLYFDWQCNVGKLEKGVHFFDSYKPHIPITFKHHCSSPLSVYLSVCLSFYLSVCLSVCQVALAGVHALRSERAEILHVTGGSRRSKTHPFLSAKLSVYSCDAALDALSSNSAWKRSGLLEHVLCNPQFLFPVALCPADEQLYIDFKSGGGVGAIQKPSSSWLVGTQGSLASGVWDVLVPEKPEKLPPDTETGHSTGAVQGPRAARKPNPPYPSAGEFDHLKVRLCDHYIHSLVG